jgi:hypothetical protein
MTTVLPAYGRQYANAAAAKLDWHNGKDFLESSSRLACNRQDFPGDIVIRYGNGNIKVTSYTAADARKLDKQIAAARATRPQFADFDAWMVSVDKAVIAESGMSYKDLPDWDFRTAFDDGIDPKTVAASVIADAW